MMRKACEITALETGPLSEEGLYRRWAERMPRLRREKIASLRNPEDRRLSLGAGILLLRAMERRGLEAEKTEFGEGRYGKPFLTSYPEMHFSLSHAGSWALCAVSDRPAGCDVERLGRGDPRIPGRFFHPEERAALEAAGDPAEWDRLFGRIWTRKESYLKATGRGLSHAMAEFSVMSGPEEAWFDEKDLAEGYCFCCCVLGGPEPSFTWQVETLT